MSQGETYITFDIDEDSNYYRTPSFNSAPREQEEDDAIADEITSESNIVKAAVHQKFIKLTELMYSSKIKRQINPLNKRSNLYQDWKTG